MRLGLEELEKRQVLSLDAFQVTVVDQTYCVEYEIPEELASAVRWSVSAEVKSPRGATHPIAGANVGEPSVIDGDFKQCFSAQQNSDWLMNRRLGEDVAHGKRVRRNTPQISAAVIFATHPAEPEWFSAVDTEILGRFD